MDVRSWEAERARLRAIQERREETARRNLEEMGTALAVRLESDKDRDFYVLHPSTYEPGKWQLTRFIVHEGREMATGHEVHRTPLDAFMELGAGWRIVQRWDNNPADPSGDLLNPEEVHPIIRPEINDVVARVLAAGAVPPLTYLGAGMTSIVLCDSRGRGYKAGRRITPTNYRVLEAEAEFLEAAKYVPAMRGRVARFVAWHPDELVIERECVTGETGTWGRSRKIDEAHREIEGIMLPHGWTAPEFKEDSYVFVDGQPILVDAGFAHRVGDVLIAYAQDVLAGIRLHPENRSDLAFQLRREAQEGTVDPRVAEELSGALRRER
jgi:hypothetical protein